MESCEIRLSDAPLGNRCIIKSLKKGGNARRRLIDLGFAPGAEVECVGASPFGDPRAYRVRSAVVALRSEDASDILIE